MIGIPCSACSIDEDSLLALLYKLATPLSTHFLKSFCQNLGKTQALLCALTVSPTTSWLSYGETFIRFHLFFLALKGT